MDEFSFINQITPVKYRQSSLIRGAGDDAAIFQQSYQEIVTAVDTFVEDIHFSKSTMEPFHAGYRSLAASVSDLVAMGAKPAFYLVSIVIPSDWREADLTYLYQGMACQADTYRMDLIGGDTTAGDKLTLSITVIGYVNKDKARYRHTAKTDDIIFVTGTLGDSAAGVHMLKHPSNYHSATYFYERHRMPSIRYNLVSGLDELSRVTLNDISDGIANEANEIAKASHVDMFLYDDAIPVSHAFHQFPYMKQHHWKLYGGEDFELIGTLPAEDWPILQNIASETNTLVTPVGYVKDQAETTSSVFLIDEQNTKTLLQPNGYMHFE